MAISKPAAADAKLVTVTVAVGEIWTADGKFGRGQDVQVTAAEARRFIELGVVRGEDYVPPVEVQDGKLRLTSSDGPSIVGVA